MSASCLYVYKRQPRTMVSDGNCYLTLLNKLTGNCAATQAGMETLTVNELHRNARDVTVVLKGESSCVHQQDMKVISLTQVHNCFQYLTGSAPIPHVIQSIPYNIDFLRWHSSRIFVNVHPVLLCSKVSEIRIITITIIIWEKKIQLRDTGFFIWFSTEKYVTRVIWPYVHGPCKSCHSAGIASSLFAIASESYWQGLALGIEFWLFLTYSERMETCLPLEGLQNYDWLPRQAVFARKSNAKTM